MVFKKVKGVADYYPEEKNTQDTVFSVFDSVARKYYFEKVEAPVIESMDLLTKKSGEEIVSQIFSMQKKGKENIGLRFEFTASLARMFIQRQKSLSKPVKWYSVDRVWRYERPQAGRDREFYQFNAEIYGSKNPEADAEVINLAIDSLRQFGLTRKDIVVRINNRQLLTGLLEKTVPKRYIEEVIRIIDKRAKISENEFKEELSFLSRSQIKEIIGLMNTDWKGLKSINMNVTARDAYENLQEVFKYVHKDFVVFDMKVARGLDYYTGTVFEIYDREGKFRSLCGGGRYDDMIETFGGEKTPATGFGMGYSTVKLLLEQKGLLKNPLMGPEYFIAVVDEESRAFACKIASDLRRKYVVAVDVMKRTLTKQLKYADAINAENVIVIGPDEIKKNKVKIKNMQTGKQREVSVSKII